ncbi:MAG: hypothetical protein ACXAD7_21075 [Candidatus Kariarchaeaceae archaeon]|jgi:hypothetical protein
MRVVLLVILISILLLTYQIPETNAEMEEKSGYVVLNVENNWVFSELSSRVKVGGLIQLQWTTNGSSTGWIHCSTENEVAKAINSTQTGSLSLIASDPSCSVVIYRIFKPVDNRTIYQIQYSYSWELDTLDSPRSDNNWLIYPLFIGIVVILIIFKTNKDARK